jgi:succinate dehydrogenase/fumarate reductase flavoprotein subunit
MKHSFKIAAAAILALGGLAVTAPTASAAIVCNGAGYCWHVRHPYAYAPGYGVVVHPDGWRWGPGEHYVWREHAGRGYWRDGVWIRF